MNKITWIFIFTFLSCVLFAQERENRVSIVSQMAVYSQSLPQPDGSLLIAEDFTYGSVRNADKKSSQYGCYVIRAHHISTDKNEVFVPYLPGHCQDDLHGPMVIPGTDYLLYQMSTDHPQHTYIWMKKALK